MKDKTTAALLALLLGGLGFHKFYLGRVGQGLIYLFFCWTFIPALLGLVEGIIYLCMSDWSFDAKYNPGLTWAAYPQPQPHGMYLNAAAPVADVAAQIRSLMELRTAGALTDEEFQAQKRKLLAAG